MLQAILMLGITVVMVTGQSNIQGIQVPQGSKVELEVEFRTQRNGQRGHQQQQQQQQQQIAGARRFTPPSSATQQLMNNMATLSLRMRRMTNVPVPIIEEPCPCDADCCARPMEPRRLVPVLEVPMTSHYGCCGCIDCPISSYPMVGHMVMSAVMMDRSAGRSTMGPA